MVLLFRKEINFKRWGKWPMQNDTFCRGSIYNLLNFERDPFKDQKISWTCLNSSLTLWDWSRDPLVFQSLRYQIVERGEKCNNLEKPQINRVYKLWCLFQGECNAFSSFFLIDGLSSKQNGKWLFYHVSEGRKIESFDEKGSV